MKTKDAVKHFGSKLAVANAIGVTKQAVSAWGELVPKGRDYQIQIITDGKLKADHLKAA